MALFFKILLTMFIAEMGDKTQLLLVAMTSRFKLRDIILGSAAAILVLNGLAVGVGSLISRLIPPYLIKIIAALAFFFFAWSSLSGDGDEEENSGGKESKLPILTVFGTFFVAELGDKTFLDGLAPAVEVLTQAAKAGPIGAEAAQAAADAAWQAFENTRGMLARHGRMAIRGEASRELLDPGAAVAALLMKGYAEFKADSE